MTATSNSIPALDKEAALNWLRNAGEVETTITALAGERRWDRSRASRILDRWERDGLITRRSVSGRKIVFSTCPAIPPVDALSPAVNTGAQQIEGTARISAGPAVPTVHAAGANVHTAAQLETRRARSLNVLSALMILVAIGLGFVGLLMNARFAASFGRSDEAASLLFTIGAPIEVLVVMLPSVGRRLCRSGSRAVCAAAWCLWLFTAAMSLLAGTGFGATNIGDAIADRDKVVLEVIGVRATVNRLRAERTAITDTRSTAVLQAQSERERALVDRNVWKATRGCHDVTVYDSAAACTAVMATHIAMAAAARRDAIDAELRTTEEKLATLPAIQAVADPQAEMTAKIIDLISIGRITPEPQQIAPIRIMGLALIPILAGIAMMLGMALRREAAVP
jgi:hypothetical protein